MNTTETKVLSVLEKERRLLTAEQIAEIAGVTEKDAQQALLNLECKDLAYYAGEGLYSVFE